MGAQTDFCGTPISSLATGQGTLSAHQDVLRVGALLGILATSSPGSALESSRQPRSSVRTWEPSWWRSTLPRRTKPSLVWPRLPGAARTTDLTTGLVALSLLK